jgi:hypothetical protein
MKTETALFHLSGRLLGLQLAASDPHAVQAVTRAMRAAKGSIRSAAAALGVHEGSLSRWLRLPQLAKAAALRQGRESVGARSKTSAAKNKATAVLCDGCGVYVEPHDVIEWHDTLSAAPSTNCATCLARWGMIARR